MLKGKSSERFNKENWCTTKKKKEKKKEILQKPLSVNMTLKDKTVLKGEYN